MATINEVLERVSRVRADAYDDVTKAGWLLELEGKLYREVILRHKRTPGVRPLGPQVSVCPQCGSGELSYDKALDCCSCTACRWSELPPFPRRFPEDGDLPLLVPPPYDELYGLYLFSQLDLYNREIQNYNNSVALFNAALDEWRQSYHRTHLPLSRGGYRNLI